MRWQYFNPTKDRKIRIMCMSCLSFCFFALCHLVVNLLIAVELTVDRFGSFLGVLDG